MLTPVDPQALARLTAELAATSYHQLLVEYVQARIAELQADDVTKPYVAMKRRGQVEELQRLILPATVQHLALHGLSLRALAEAEPPAAETLAQVRRDWWEEERV
ncbi:MAG TPA: hypothetical protein VLK79_12685 [Gaiellales bacterium]|nr:hypothetical protein [Gaiellales bacterium]